MLYLSLRHPGEVRSGISVFLHAAIYLILMVYKLMTGPTFRSEAFGRRDPIGELSELRRFSPLIYMLLRDGLFYFVM